MARAPLPDSLLLGHRWPPWPSCVGLDPTLNIPTTPDSPRGDHRLRHWEVRIRRDNLIHTLARDSQHPRYFRRPNQMASHEFPD